MILGIGVLIIIIVSILFLASAKTMNETTSLPERKNSAKNNKKRLKKVGEDEVGAFCKAIISMFLEGCKIGAMTFEIKFHDNDITVKERGYDHKTTMAAGYDKKYKRLHLHIYPEAIITYSENKAEFLHVLIHELSHMFTIPICDMGMERFIRRSELINLGEETTEILSHIVKELLLIKYKEEIIKLIK